MGVVEFIESIPYNETRNYVKKILEITLCTSLYIREKMFRV